MKRKERANSAKKEEGICILCGGDKEGAPAEKDAAVSSARFLRSILGMAERHSVACKACLPLCLEKRRAFEKNLQRYRLYAGIFVLALVAGSAAFRGFSLFVLFPAIIGAAIILLLPYGRYFPKFRANEEK